jgi:TRAP-type C4-dicarboxylate transport system permease small subunit
MIMAVPLMPPNDGGPKTTQARPSGWFSWRALNLVVTAAVLIVALLLGLGGWRLYSALKTEDGLTAAAYEEWTSAKADHAVIVAVAKQCEQTSATISHPFAVPAPLLTIIPNGRPQNTLPTDGPPDGSAPMLKVDAPSFMLAALVLSNEIGRSRVDVAGDKVQDNAWMQIFEWVLVLFCSVTTILISIKSLSAERSATLTAIGIGAIIFSTLGTSIAAVNSFYSPRSTYERDERTLTNLRSLHLQLAAGVTRDGDLCSTWTNWSKDWRFARIKAFTDQYTAITTAAEATDLPSEGGDAPAASLPGSSPSGALGLPASDQITPKAK